MKIDEVATSFRDAQRKRLRLAYSLAVVLPLLCSLITAHTRLLHNFPVALHFLPVIAITLFGGVGPGLAAGAMSALARIVQGAWWPYPPPTPNADLFRFAVMLAIIAIIAITNRGRQRSQKNLEQALQTLQDRSADLIETLKSTRCACWTLDLDSGNSARWYPGSFEVFGRPFAEIEQMPSLLALLHPDDQPRLAGVVQQMRAGNDPVVFEYRSLWPNGELHWLEMRATRIGQDASRWRGVTYDITERRTAEAALLRSEKLAAMGRLASTVAHEINNPLESVTNLLYLALSRPDLDPETRTYLATADAELARLGNITRLTLGYVRDSGQRSTADVATVAEEVLAIFSHRAEIKSAAIERQYAAEVLVAMPPHELRQVLTNLIANAADALTESPFPRLRLQVSAASGFAVLLVADNGSGIDSTDAERIFEPFFSTKAEVGTGIGLWVTRELVEKNGGTISITTIGCPAGMRTCFRLELPLAEIQAHSS